MLTLADDALNCYLWDQPPQLVMDHMSLRWLQSMKDHNHQVMWWYMSLNHTAFKYCSQMVKIIKMQISFPEMGVVVRWGAVNISRPVTLKWKGTVSDGLCGAHTEPSQGIEHYWSRECPIPQQVQDTI